MKTLRKTLVTTALAAGAVMGYAAVPEPAPGAEGPAGSPPSAPLPVSERFDEPAVPSADEAMRRGERARSCNERARARRLAGDDRRIFMVRCMHR